MIGIELLGKTFSLIVVNIDGLAFILVG